MRIVLCFALLCAVSPVYGQGLVGGVAVDSATSARLPCVDVTLEDTTGRIVAHTQTDLAGTFQFEPPSRGTYRYRFSVWYHAPMFGPMQMLDPSTERAQTFHLAFVPVTPAKIRLWPDTADSPPGPPLVRGSLPQIPTRGTPGTVTMTYAVDSTGRVHERSIRVVAATDSLMVPPIASFLKSVVLHPARRDGEPVCALMLNQPFNFRTGR